MVAILGAARRQFKGEIVHELYAALVRFGMWDQILAEPQPNPKLAGLTGGYLYAEATALAATGRVDEAKAHLAELENLAASVAAEGDAGLDRSKRVLAVAIPNVRARIALAEGNADKAINLLREVVAKEDQLAYSEPAHCFFPTRHILGAVLIKAAGRARRKRPTATISPAARTTAGNSTASRSHCGCRAGPARR
jgi:hypothetical protein